MATGTERRSCEFCLLRYVPDAVRNEYVHIGVILRDQERHYLPATAADLYREGQAMHHCVATYADRVREGACYVFSVRRSGKRVATVSLFRHGGRVLIEQVRGPCNSTPTTAMMTAVQQWLHTRPAIQPRDQQPEGFERISSAIRGAIRAAKDDVPF